MAPYYSINSSALIYPPPTLITSFPFIIFAIIYLVPNKYLPAANLFIGMLMPTEFKIFMNNSSTRSPFTAL